MIHGSGLSWETSLERKAWSDFLIDQILAHWGIISSAKDIREIIPDFDSLSKEQSAVLFAELMVCVAYYESSWRPAVTAKDVNGRSEKKYLATGLFQMNEIDQVTYKTGTAYTHEELKNPIVNIEVAVKIILTVIQVRGKITFYAHEKSPILRYFFATLVKDTSLGRKVFADYRREYARMVKLFAPVKPVSNEVSELRNQIVEMLCKDVGQRENNGKNRSPLIDAICKFFGLPMGQPYCIGWVVYRIDGFCKEKGLKNPIPKTMSTQEFWRKTPEKYKKHKGIKGKKADVCIQQQYASPTKGHAYVLTKDEELEQSTVEANTNVQGSRDGDGIYFNTRSQSGDISKKYLGAVDVAQWIIDENKA